MQGRSLRIHKTSLTPPHSCACTKYLYTLSVPHTIISIDLTPDKPNKKQLQSQFEVSKSPTANSPAIQEQTPLHQTAFRCGTPGPSARSRSSARRRHDYSKSIQKVMARPKTASDYFAQLERAMKMKAQKEEIESRRAFSASVAQQKARSLNMSKTTLSQSVSTIQSPRRTIEQKENVSPARQLSPSNANRITMCSKLQNMFKKPGSATTYKTATSVGTTKSKGFVIPTPDTYSIPVFQPVNVRKAPRMYYKPWKGDKLPVADVKRKVLAPKFI